MKASQVPPHARALQCMHRTMSHIVCVDVCVRSMALLSLCTAGFTLSLLLVRRSTILLAGARASVLATNTVLYIYTPEVWMHELGLAHPMAVAQAHGLQLLIEQAACGVVCHTMNAAGHRYGTVSDPLNE